MGIFETRQMPHPDLSALKDDVGILPLSSDYMPAVMQALHYYIQVFSMKALRGRSKITSTSHLKYI